MASDAADAQQSEPQEAAQQESARQESAPPPSAPPAGDDAYGATWFAATRAASAVRRPPLTQDLDVDVCIVGGGLAGLTTAREVARRGWSVAVIEAKQVAWNASGRNTGFVIPGFGQSADNIIERVGIDHARELWALSQAGVDYVREAVAESSIPGIEESSGWLSVSKRNLPQRVSDEADVLRSLGADIEVWPSHLVRAKLKSTRYFQAIHFPTAFNVHALNYADGLAKLAEEAGARIFDGTQALSIDPAGVRKRVVTSGGRVRAARIVLAGNVHLGPIMPEISKTLIPVHTFAVVTRPLGETLKDAVDYPGSVSDGTWADSHYRIVGGDRLMWCGRMTVWDANPRRFGRRLRRDLRRRFRQLGDVEIDYAWTGVLGITVHRMPQIGEVAPGVWLASGFGGHGINTTAMAGNLIARAIIEGDDRWRLFQPFELVWAGGGAGRIVLQTAYWAHRKYERWASERDRRVEIQQIRDAPRLKREAERKAERARERAERKEAAALAAAERAEARRIEKERIAAWKLEQKRIASEQRAAERAEALRLKAERAEAERVEAQRRAAEAEAARFAQEQAEAERLAAEQIAAEEAAQAPADMVPPAEPAEALTGPDAAPAKPKGRRKHRDRG